MACLKKRDVKVNFFLKNHVFGGVPESISFGG
jgi:hypothetical protein